GLTSIPVADSQLQGKNAFPLPIKDDVKTVLAGVFAGCNESSAPSAQSAPALLTELILAEKGKVRLIVTGPLTNVAAALQMDQNKQLVEKIEAVQIMGGAVHVGGNLCCGADMLGFSNTQEFNIWADPAAAAKVFGAFPPGVIKLVSLDATQFVPVT